MTPTPGTTFVVWLIVLVAVGFVMMLLFKLAVWWGERGANMSSYTYVPDYDENESSPRSYAVEQGSEPSGTVIGNIAEQLGTLTDDARLAVLANITDADGNYVYADSRIAKFIGGRVEDRVRQVRDVRGTDAPPPKPQPVLRVRDNGHERLIAKYGQEG